MPIPELAGIYLALSILMGLLGRRRKLGAWGYFFASILLTPVIGFLLVLASDVRPRVARPDPKLVAEIERRIYRRSGGLVGKHTGRR